MLSQCAPDAAFCCDTRIMYLVRERGDGAVSEASFRARGKMPATASGRAPRVVGETTGARPNLGGVLFPRRGDDEFLGVGSRLAGGAAR